jgi:putative DNA primase/helicase
MSDITNQFRVAIASTGLTSPEEIVDDGKIHRFSSNGKPRDESGWYVLHSDGVAAGAFGCWREGFSQNWCSKSTTEMTQSEREAHQNRVQAMKAQRDSELELRNELAAVNAVSRFKAATTCTSHPYLTIKGVQAHGIRLEGDNLLIPMRDTAGNLHSLQTITPEGDKRFMTGGRVKGCYFSIGKPTGKLIVCEGYATGASIFEATGDAVAVAFNAGNLEPVAQALRAKYSDLKIVLAADDDYHTEGNPGMTKARAAAAAVGGYLAVPDFGDNRPDKATDFNDLFQFAGLDMVKRCIEAAKHLIAACASNTWATGQVDSWNEPTPLPNELPPVQPFDAELLPVALRDWVMDIAHLMQCPPDFPAVGAIAALSSLIGARHVIQPKAFVDWHVVPNLWALIVGRPGVMKSPALGEVMKPLNRLEATEREWWQAAHESWELDCKVEELAGADREKKAKGLASKDPMAARALLEPTDTPAEPTARRYIVNDATVEKLGELLEVNPWGTLAYRDELYSLLTSLDRQGQEGSRGFYLQAYDGDKGYTFDRIIRGTHFIPRVCLAMLGGTQPGKIQKYVRDAVSGGSADDGLLQRFGLTVWPDVAGEFKYVDQWPDTPAKQAAWAVFERLAQLQPATDTEPVVWRFSPEAQALFVEWLVPFETEIRGEELHPAMVSHLAKYRKLIPALALIFALIDTPDSGGIVNETELIRALAMGDYLRSHANRLYAAAVIPETTNAATLLSKIKAGKLTDRDGVVPDSFTPRQVAVKHWAGLGTPADARMAADVLVDYDYLRREAVPSGAAGGRPSDRYLINPALLKGGAA